MRTGSGLQIRQVILALLDCFGANLGRAPVIHVKNKGPTGEGTPKMAKAASMEAIMAERRHEPRAQVDLAVQISGTGANGMPFTQSATASSISNGGALLSGLFQEIRSGDLLWVEYQQRKARFRIVWVRDSQSERKTQAAVQRLAKEECPWP
jgi:hypothetical protein